MAAVFWVGPASGASRVVAQVAGGRADLSALFVKMRCVLINPRTPEVASLRLSNKASIHADRGARRYDARRACAPVAWNLRASRARCPAILRPCFEVTAF